MITRQALRRVSWRSLSFQLSRVTVGLDCSASHFASDAHLQRHPLRPILSSARSLTADRRKDIIPTNDTIYALSTGHGRAAIAVIRISGPACLDIYGGLCPNRPFPHPRTATLRKLYDPELNGPNSPRVLDNGALVLYFPTPNTVTGEPILELHVHGGPAIVKSVLEAIPRCVCTRPRRRTAEFSFIRPAEPGEFTKRAFYNGRLDLTQAEALGEALAAETEQQRRLAVMGADSGLAKRYEDWRQTLLNARGELEALIDFSEDQHFDESPVEFMASVSKQILHLERQIKLHVTNSSRGELLRNGISVAILGAPNAGKSSLLNRIVGREAAIVSAEAGTTRDIVDVSVDINGWLCRLGDMAGLRKGLSAPFSGTTATVGLVEKEGIRRARERALQSDVVIVLLSIEQAKDGRAVVLVNEEVRDAFHECQGAGKSIVVVVNKSDRIMGLAHRNQELASMHKQVSKAFPMIPTDRTLAISCLDVQTTLSTDPGNIQMLLNSLTQVFTDLTTAQSGNLTDHPSPEEVQAYWSASLSITHRQKAYLEQCLAHLQDFLAQARTGSTHHIDTHDDLVRGAQIDIVTAAEHLRYAAACLAKMTGKGEGGDVEDVLGVVFEK